MNIVANVLQVLTPVVAGRIAAAFGISPTLANTAIAAVVPAILAALAGKAATPAGASALSSTLATQDTSLPGSFSSKLEGSDKANLIAAGNSALSSLLGAAAPGTLANAAARFAGIEQSSASGLIGTLAPVVLGSLAATQKQGGLDASGLANLLEGQKQNIAAALPAGFASLLGGSGLLPSLPSVPKAAPAGPSVQPKVPEAPSFNWLPYAIGIAAALVLYALLARPAAPPSAPTDDRSASRPSPVATAEAEALKQVQLLVPALTGTLSNVKDAATAQSAVPDLTKAGSAVDSLQNLIALIPPEQRKRVTDAISAALPGLLPLVSQALAIPGVDAILKPLLDPIVAKLTALAKG